MNSSWVFKKKVGYSKYIDPILKSGLQFINDNPKIIKGIYKHTSYNDEPKLYGYTVYFREKYSHAEHKYSGAAGLAFEQKKALLKTLGETVERYSLGVNNNKRFIFSSFNDLVKFKKMALDPNSLVLFSNKKHRIPNLNNKKLHWIQVESLLSNKKIFMPAQLVYVPYLYHDSEPILRFPISTGAAAGVTLTSALYRGICEVVERDAFMIAYLNKIPSPQVDLSAIKDKLIYDIINIFKRYKLEMIVLDLTTDLQIPVFAAITLDRTGIGPAVSVGLKSGFHIKEAILGAIEESLMVRYWTRDQLIHRNPHYRMAKKIQTIEDRAYFWFHLSSIKYIDFWLKKRTFKKVDSQKSISSDNNLENIVKLFKQKNIEAMYVDITDKKVKKYGFVVVKVIIPQLQPLFLEEEYSCLKEDRLYDAQVKMGYVQKPSKKRQLNRIPHPFL